MIKTLESILNGKIIKLRRLHCHSAELLYIEGGDIYGEELTEKKTPSLGLLCVQNWRFVYLHAKQMLSVVSPYNKPRQGSMMFCMASRASSCPSDAVNRIAQTHKSAKNLAGRSDLPTFYKIIILASWGWNIRNRQPPTILSLQFDGCDDYKILKYPKELENVPYTFPACYSM